MDKKGQVAIFIIVAVLLFVALTVFFLARDSNIILPTGTEFSPDRYMSSCVRQAVRETTDTLLSQGGVVNPTDYITVNNTRVAYVCKNINYYAPCVTQYPLFISHLRKELQGTISDEVSSCLVALKTELERRNYAVELGSHSINVELKPELVEVSIPIELTLTKNEVRQQITQLGTTVRMPLYDVGLVVQEIAAQEAQYCYFEYVGYMFLYPSYDIRLTTQSDATKIYSVTHLPTDKTMRFAIRGCAFPAGI